MAGIGNRERSDDSLRMTVGESRPPSVGVIDEVREDEMSVESGEEDFDDSAEMDSSKPAMSVSVVDNESSIGALTAPVTAAAVPSLVLSVGAARNDVEGEHRRDSKRFKNGVKRLFCKDCDYSTISLPKMSKHKQAHLGRLSCLLISMSHLSF